MAAGLGFKTFATGDVLTAADTNGYLMQGVLVFASAAARTSAITSPQEGQMSYLKDTDSVESYSGAAWVAVGGSTAPSYFAGKNSIIGGGFDIWQRGTSFTIASSTQTYTADRWMAYRTATGATITRQNTSSIYSPYFVRVARDSGNTGTQVIYLTQAIETLNSKPLAGQAVTLSWYARAGANFSAASSNMTYELAYGTGTDQNMISGFTGQTNVSAGTKTLTTSWQRFTASGTVNASATQLGVNFYFTPVGTAGAADYMEISDVQLELGSTATTFARAGGTIQGELANCQRYYFRTQTGTNEGYFGVTVAGGATTTYANVIMKQTMRTTPTSVDFSGLKWQAINNSGNISSASITGATPENVLLVCGTTGATAGVMNYLMGQTNAAYVGFSAEL